MAYKCKTCGYRFKSDDSDLCPECFTARNDIGCETFEKHSHGKFSANTFEGDDFLKEQLASENASAKKFKKEHKYDNHNNQNNRSAQNPYARNNTYGNTARPANPNYVKFNYNSGRTMPNNSYSTNSPSFQGYNPNIYSKKVVVRTPSKAGCIITLIIMIFIIIIPIATTLIGEYMSDAFSEENEVDEVYGEDTIYNYSYDTDFYVSEPEYTLPDGKKLALILPDDLEDEDNVDWDDIDEEIDVVDEDLCDYDWIYKYFDFTVEDIDGKDVTGEYEISEITVYGFDTNYMTVYSYTQNNDNDSFLDEPYKLIYNDNVEWYHVSIAFESETNGTYHTTGFYFVKDSFWGN